MQPTFTTSDTKIALKAIRAGFLVITGLAFCASIVYAALVQVDPIPAQDVIGYAYRVVSSEDGTVAPTNTINRFRWRRKCADCGTFQVVEDPGSDSVATINPSFGSKQWEVTAYYEGLSDPQNPTPPPPTTLATTYSVLNLDNLSWTFDPSDTAEWTSS